MLDKNMFGEVPEVVHSAVVDAIDLLEERGDMEDNSFAALAGKRPKRHRNAFRLPRAVAACFICFLVSGITVSAMGAIHLYRQRMEEMDKKLLEEYYSIAGAGETTNLSRPYTNDEEKRYENLKEAYEKNGLFPEAQVVYLQSADEYSGEGIALDSGTRTLYLPAEELSDEELLEIIDFEHKISYSIYAKNEEKIASGADWKSRMAEMDDKMVDEVYLTMFSSNLEISGGYNRQLSEKENSRYEELKKCYEEEGMFTESELTVIQSPEEYSGTEVAICVKDSTFYLPEHELTDEEFLQLIDFEHKVIYCLDRINQEVQMGLREGYPEF